MALPLQWDNITISLRNAVAEDGSVLSGEWKFEFYSDVHEQVYSSYKQRMHS
jgi:hypothetical protein